MSTNQHVFPITGTSPSSASTVILGSAVSGLIRFNWFTIHVALLGATGGTLNVYLQRKITDDLWSDWVAFPQLAAGAAAVRYAVGLGVANSISTVGAGTDAIPAPALTANSVVGGHPGDKVRAVCVAGASTSAGAAQSIYIVGHRVRG